MANPVLLVVDAQQGFRNQDYWGQSSNPEVLANIQKLLLAFRARGLPIVFVKHNSSNLHSPLHPSSSGNALEPSLSGASDLIIQKSVNSAFYGKPDLQQWLKEGNYQHLVICGITTNYCCETTARMAGNLGFQVEFVIDATTAFPLDSAMGIVSGAAVMNMTAANLSGEFATVLSTHELIQSLQ